VTYNAQGTRLTRRGLETRRQILEVAVRCLVEGGPDALSANRIARDAGVTWGTIQHHFGDSDGVWAAVLDRLAEDLRTRIAAAPRRQTTVVGRVRSIVETLFAEWDTHTSRAVQTLRQSLPQDEQQLAKEFPASAAAFRRCNEAWIGLTDELFRDLGVSNTKLRRVRVLIPVAVEGIHLNATLSTLIDPAEARSALVDVTVGYLNA
jgi:AcrR family transcriptional regulator